jgi:hypothetical protein
MTVAYAPGGDARRPMIRIANRRLTHCGFVVGSKYIVTYEKGSIIIKKITS